MKPTRDTSRPRSARRHAAVVEPLEARTLLSTIYANVNNTTGIQNGTAAYPYVTIQAAINAATTAGTVIGIAPGTYAEALVINHPVILQGPNAGVNPTNATRGPEAVIVPPVNAPSSGIDILVECSDVTINGLTIEGSNPALTGGEVLNGVSINAKSGVSTVDTSGNPEEVGGLTVTDNIIRDFTGFGVIGDANNYSGPIPYISTGNVISNNWIDNIPYIDVAPIGTSLQGRGISVEDDFYATITGNSISRAATGIQTIFELDPDPTGVGTVITGNDVAAYDRGILAYTIDTDTNALNISNNDTYPLSSTASASCVGIDINQLLDTSKATIANNYSAGWQIGLLDAASSATAGVTVTGGSLPGNEIGAEVTNANNDVPTPTSTASDVVLTLNNVTINGSFITGVDVVGVNTGPTASVVLNIGAGTTATNDPHGALWSGPGAHLLQVAAPTVAFTSTPALSTASTSATFVFTATDPITTTADLNDSYQLDGGTAVGVSGSTIKLTKLSIGTHKLVLTTDDQAGNKASVTYTWTVT